MCGISGYIGKYNKSDIKVGAQSIAHRGPDAFGMFTEGDVTLAHHRLSILDLSDRANQPFHFEYLSLVYNGELYNFPDVRKKLELLGYTFTTSSDTEVLIKAFHQWGPDAINRFIGMFAFAMYDRRDQSIYLFRDRIGIKPLYYTLESGLAFGSELRTLIPILKDKTPDHASVYEYFRLVYISRDRSIFKNVKKLLPGHYLHYKGGKADIKTYWSLDNILREPIPILSDKDWERDLHDTMTYAFGKRMISDVPVGVFLSGGIDSSLLTSILQKNYGGIHTFTIGFDDPRYNEANIARDVAAHLGTEHTEFILTMEDAYETMQSFYEIYDEPFSDSSGIPSTIVSKLAAKAGIKVVLSGDGGDEMFAGYDRYPNTMNLYNRFRKIPTPIRKSISSTASYTYKNRLLRKVYSGNTEHKTAALAELLSAGDLAHFYSAYVSNQSNLELSSMLKHSSLGCNNVDLISQDMEGLMYYELLHYLPDDLLVKMDRATMYNSIEGREPFLDHMIVELSVKIPMRLKYRDGQSKWILRQILGEYIPEKYFNRPKKGFSIPIFQWFSQYMDTLFEHYLERKRLEQVGLFNTEEILHEYKKYKWNKEHNKEYNIEKMWRILSFMMWWDRWNEKL